MKRIQISVDESVMMVDENVFPIVMHGKEYRITMTRDPKEAKKAHTYRAQSLERLIQEVQRGMGLSREEMGLRGEEKEMDDFFPQFMDAIQNAFRLSVREKWQSLYVREIQGVFGEMRLSDIMERDIRTWVENMRQNEYEDDRISQAVRLMGKIMKTAEARREIAFNPMPVLHFRRKERARRGPLPKQVQEVIREHRMEDVITGICYFMLVTGARCSEAVAIRMSDVNLEGGFLRICRLCTAANNQGKGQIYRPGTKNTPSRLIRLGQEEREFLRSWMEKVKEMQAKDPAGWNPEGVLFCNGAGRMMRTSDVLREMRKRYGGWCEMRGHDLRRTYACNLYERSGRDLELVRRSLNVSSMQTVLRYLRQADCGQEALVRGIDMIYGAMGWSKRNRREK